MTEIVDGTTGEIKPNGAVSERASAAIASRWHQKHIDDRYMGFVQLYAALLLAQREIEAVVSAKETATVQGKSKNSGKSYSYNYKYADLRAVLDVARGPLLKHGILIRQGSERLRRLDGNGPCVLPVFTDLIHAESGEVSRTAIDIPLQAIDAPAAGSAMTYGKRYTLLAALGLATEDDDGKKTEGRNKVAQTPAASKAAQALISDLQKTKDIDALDLWPSYKDADIKALSDDDQTALRDAYKAHKHTLTQATK